MEAVWMSEEDYFESVQKIQKRVVQSIESGVPVIVTDNRCHFALLTKYSGLSTAIIPENVFQMLKFVQNKTQFEEFPQARNRNVPISSQKFGVRFLSLFPLSGKCTPFLHLCETAYLCL